MESLNDVFNVLLDALDAEAQKVSRRHLDVNSLRRAVRALAQDPEALNRALRAEVVSLKIEIRISRTDLPRKGHPYGRTVYSVYVNGEEREAFYSKRTAITYANTLRKQEVR